MNNINVIILGTATNHDIICRMFTQMLREINNFCFEVTVPGDVQVAIALRMYNFDFVCLVD